MPSWTRRLLRALILFGSVLAIESPCPAQDKNNSIDWQDGPIVGKLGDIARISIPMGYRFTGKTGAQKLLELTQNPTDGNELGALIPAVDKNEDIWFVVFEFDDAGYVRDTEKDTLDAGAILGTIQKSTEESNKVRAQKGWPAFHVIGWSHNPYYDTRTHNLTWAVLGKSQEPGKPEERSVNYSVRLLGRGGIMKADLVLSPGQLSQVVPQFDALLDGFSFVPGQTYADWRSGDKVAKYGLTALVVGGAAAAAVKTGLLFKFWKLIVAAFVALVAFLKRVFSYIKRTFAGKAADETPQHE
jgi:uncharacterized membrane-anchored protein